MRPALTIFRKSFRPGQPRSCRTWRERWSSPLCSSMFYVVCFLEVLAKIGPHMLIAAMILVIAHCPPPHRPMHAGWFLWPDKARPLFARIEQSAIPVLCSRWAFTAVGIAVRSSGLRLAPGAVAVRRSIGWMAAKHLKAI